jgi:hypothetical protein
MKRSKEQIEKEYLEEVGLNFSTQGYKKLWNYLLDVAKADFFRNRVSELRVKYNIPNEGFKNGGILFEMPELWQEGYTFKGKSKLLRRVWVDLGELARKYQLYSPEWKEVLGYYLFYNELKPVYADNIYNLCFLSDLNAEEKTRGKKKRYDRMYPIAIKISPYATERDILDYVKRMFSLIKEYQQTYKNPEAKIGKVRRKKESIQQRNNFIYENKKLSLNETRKLVSEKFGEYLDYEYIGKIRSEEIRKRKEV